MGYVGAGAVAQSLKRDDPPGSILRGVTVVSYPKFFATIFRPEKLPPSQAKVASFSGEGSFLPGWPETLWRTLLPASTMPPKAKSRGQNQNAPSSGAGSAKGGGKSKSQSAFSDATRLFGESKRLIQMGAKESMKASGAITMSRLMSKGVVLNDLDETSSGLRVTLNRDGQVTMLESCRHSNAFRIGEGAWSRINVPQWEWVDDSLASEDIFAGMNRFVSIRLFKDSSMAMSARAQRYLRWTGSQQSLFAWARCSCDCRNWRSPFRKGNNQSVVTRIWLRGLNLLTCPTSFLSSQSGGLELHNNILPTDITESLHSWLGCFVSSGHLTFVDFFDIENEILPVLLPIDCWGLFTSHKIKDLIMKQPVMECRLSILVKWIDSQKNIISICQEVPWYFMSIHVSYSFVLFSFQMT